MPTKVIYSISSVSLLTYYLTPFFKTTEANTPPFCTPTGMISSHHRSLPHDVPTTPPTYYNNNNLIIYQQLIISDLPSQQKSYSFSAMCTVWGYALNFCFTVLLYVIIINYYLAVFLLLIDALSSLVMRQDHLNMLLSAAH
jgi:hypothetical protein